MDAFSRVTCYVDLGHLDIGVFGPAIRSSDTYCQCSVFIHRIDRLFIANADDDY
jgi:hypothetical protein